MCGDKSIVVTCPGQRDEAVPGEALDGLLIRLPVHECRGIAFKGCQPFIDGLQVSIRGHCGSPWGMNFVKVGMTAYYRSPFRRFEFK